jgi:hypothetical protein
MNMKVNKKDRHKLTRTTIVVVAVKIADKDGINLVSMRKVANKLGVEAMSLYHHFANKDDLIAGMIEHVAPRIDPPNQNTSWQDAMRKRAHTTKHILENHPWATLLFMSGINDGPRMLKYADSTIGYLMQAGFSSAQADYAWNIVDSYIYGFDMKRQNFPFKPSEYKKVAAEYLPYISQTELPHMYAMSESIIDGSHDGIQDFDFGLDIILEGLESKRVQNKSINK